MRRLLTAETHVQVYAKVKVERVDVKLCPEPEESATLERVKVK